MPRTLHPGPELIALVDSQDGLVTTAQLARNGLDRGFAYRRVRGGRWRWLLPGVLLTCTGGPTRRQRVLAAWLWAGEDAAVDAASACNWYGLRPDGFRLEQVDVAVPADSGCRSRDFVVVRRAAAEIEVGGRTVVPYVDAATAVVVAARRMRTEAAAVALLARALQTGLVDINTLHVARERLGDKWCSRVDAALVAVGVGLRSPAEKTNRDLILSSARLPEPQWNVWLDLGDGGREVCVDALWADAALVQEVLGKRWHAWGEQFDDTEARRGRLVAVGLAAQGVTPVQLRRQGPLVLQRLEQTYLLYAGRGLPPGVRIVAAPPWANRALVRL